MEPTNFISLRKWLIIGIVIFYNAIIVTAQTDSLSKNSQFLFPDFSKSVIRLKTGEIITANLNYNTVTQKMTFSQNGSLTDLNKPEAVDTILLQNKMFIPYKDVFLEILLNARVSLYIQHKGDLKSGGRPGAYGTTSHTLPPTSVSTYYSDNKSYELNLPENFSVVPTPLYWIKIDNTMTRIDSKRQFLKLFPKNQEELIQFIDRSDINFKRQEDLIKLVDFCNSLTD